MGTPTKPLFDDTPLEVEAILIEGYRRMSPEERLRKTWQLHAFGRALALAEVRRRFPDESDETHRLRVAARFLPAALLRRAFGWSADEDESSSC